MSYSISVPAGPVTEFKERAEQAVEAYDQQLAQNDMQLGEAQQVQIAEQIAVGAAMAEKLYGGNDVDVSAVLNGHVNADNAAGTSNTVGLYTVAKPAAAAPEPAQPAAGS